jgi:hypothetical protein
MAALETTLQEPAEQVRKLELERLDHLWFVAYPKAANGDMKALQACVRLMERRAQFQGLDAPKKTELSGFEGGPVQLSILEAVNPHASGESEIPASP